MSAPPDEISIKSFAIAFLDLIESFYVGRRVVVVGLSVGGLVALALNSMAVEAVIAVDPPLSTAKLWPLSDWATVARTQMTPAQQEWLWRILGYGLTIEDRDYHSILNALQRPARILVAGNALGQRRETTEMPGLLDAEDIAFLSTHPLLIVQHVPGVSHDIASQCRDLFVTAIREALTP